MSQFSLKTLIGNNLAQNKNHVLMSSFGIIVGISAFVFFIGLSEGIKKVVLGRIFLIDQVEVVPPKVGFGLSQLSSLFGASSNSEQLNASMMESFKGVKGIEGAYPKMKFTFPAFGYGGREILGRDIKGELIADGIDPALVKKDLGSDTDFTDQEAAVSCTTNDECRVGMMCQDNQCVPQSCEPPKRKQPDPCPGLSYCAADVKQCLRPIPILLNEQILELYNGGLAVALGKGRSLPKISKELILGFRFKIALNRSAILRSRGPSISRQVYIAGFSDKAMSVGMTLPIDYVKRFNARFTSNDASQQYHSIILKIKDQTDFPSIVQEVKKRGLELAEKTSNAEQAAKMIRTIEAIFALVSLIIVGISALNISQMFYMMIYQRKREIGLFRALGATQTHVRLIILGEASWIGLFGGSLGLVGGVCAGQCVDWIAQYLPRFPYKPESFFIYPWWIWPLALICAILFCVFGAYWPARTAALQEPSEALTR